LPNGSNQLIPSNLYVSTWKTDAIISKFHLLEETSQKVVIISEKFCENSKVFDVCKMGKHRSRLAILAKILSVINAEKGAKKTRIMYQAYLSYKLLTRYLNEIIVAGLVICDNNNFYMLTDKGKKFLANFGQYHQTRQIFETKMNHLKDQRLTLEKMCPCIDE